ncbi:DUF6262 family protein [Nonomuraea sp. SYSU D8015]|uniref:DUF6262 family protein n=1 Tax=Nonomuraea sp. SYSU D8015 TaxID=2593644 RepID=UPI001CB71C44
MAAIARRRPWSACRWLGEAGQTAATTQRAGQGLRDMIRRGDRITFRALAQSTGVSLDFLYRNARSAAALSSSATSSAAAHRPLLHAPTLTSPAASSVPLPTDSPSSDGVTARRSPP